MAGDGGIQVRHSTGWIAHPVWGSISAAGAIELWVKAGSGEHDPRPCQRLGGLSDSRSAAAIDRGIARHGRVGILPGGSQDLLLSQSYICQA